jgi:hypothetical protein
MGTRILISIAAAAFQASALLAPAIGTAQVLTDPVLLAPGVTVSPVPNGDSFDASDSRTPLFSMSEDFAFTGGPSGFLFEAIYSFPDESAAHPYGPGLIFLYDIVLSSGDVTELSVPGYSGYEVSVKQCGISNCINFGANGVLTTSASRTSDGNSVSFNLGDDLNGAAHSSNLELFTNATGFVDPFGTLKDSSGATFSIPVLTPVAAPEPSTWAMMLLGFAGLGYVGYRRTRA